VTFVVGAVTVTTLFLAVSLLLLVQSARIDGWFIAPSLALVGTLIAPLALGSLLSFWDVEASPDARRFNRRARWIVAALQVVSAVIMTAYCAFTGAPIWVAVTIAAMGIALTAAAVTIGPAAQRADQRGADETPAVWQPYTPAEFRSDLRKAVWTAAMTLIVTGALIGVVVMSLGIDGWSFVAFPFIFAAMSASVVCTLVVLRLSQRQRDAVGSDLGRVRFIGKAVLRRNQIHLSETDQLAAAKFAQLSWVVQGYQLASQLLIYVGFAAIQIFTLTTNPFAVWLLALFVLLGIVMTPIAIIQLRRTRRYAEAHRELVA
jgi:MFS family permease